MREEIYCINNKGKMAKNEWENDGWLSSSFIQCISTANKGQSTVNYCHSLAFDHPYLSCNDHCDQWPFQEIFFYFQKQLYADVLQNRCY